MSFNLRTIPRHKYSQRSFVTFLASVSGGYRPKPVTGEPTSPFVTNHLSVQLRHAERGPNSGTLCDLHQGQHQTAE